MYCCVSDLIYFASLLTVTFKSLMGEEHPWTVLSSFPSLIKRGTKFGRRLNSCISESCHSPETLRVKGIDRASYCCLCYNTRPAVHYVILHAYTLELEGWICLNNEGEVR